MATLNEIAYNIKNLAYGGNSPKEVNISTKQIKHWIHYHRAKLVVDNIDKGILSNHILWQELKLDVHNYNNVSVKLLDTLWDIYWQDKNNYSSSTQALPVPDIRWALSGSSPYDVDFIKNLPKDPEGDFNGYWIPGPTTMSGAVGQDRLLGKENRNQYGLSTSSSQVRGDFRNISSAEFVIPEILMLKNHGSIKDISLRRMVYHGSDANLGEWEDGSNIENGPQHDFIHLPMKTIDEASYSNYNRFTSSNKPYAILKRTNKQQVAFFNVTDMGPGYLHKPSEYFDKIGDVSINSGSLVLKLGGLQVSPNYFLDDTTNAEKLMRWAYDGNFRAIFSNPTQISSKREYDLAGVTLSTVPTVKGSDGNKIRDFVKWDDELSSYPLPEEYIKDLIDRFIATDV